MLKLWLNKFGSFCDGVSIVTFRFVLGCVLFYYLIRYRNPTMLQSMFYEADFLFSFPLFHFLHLKLISFQAMTLLFYGMLVSVVGMTIGLFYRISISVIFLGLGYWVLLDKTYYLDADYLMLLLLLILFCIKRVPIQDLYNKKDVSVPYWNVFLLRAQYVIVFIFMAISLMTKDWMTGRVVKSMLIDSAGGFQNEVNAPILFVVTYGLFFLTLFVAWFLIRGMWFLTVGVTILYCLILKAFMGLGVFPWILMSGLIVFINPDMLRHSLNKGLRFLNVSIPETDSVVPRESPRLVNFQIIFIVLFIYLILQTIIPLRHFFIPGSVMWNLKGSVFLGMSFLEIVQGLPISLSKKTAQIKRLVFL